MLNSPVSFMFFIARLHIPALDSREDSRSTLALVRRRQDGSTELLGATRNKVIEGIR